MGHKTFKDALLYGEDKTLEVAFDALADVQHQVKLPAKLNSQVLAALHRVEQQQAFNRRLLDEVRAAMKKREAQGAAAPTSPRAHSPA